MNETLAALVAIEQWASAAPKRSWIIRRRTGRVSVELQWGEPKTGFEETGESLPDVIQLAPAVYGAYHATP